MRTWILGVLLSLSLLLVVSFAEGPRFGVTTGKADDADAVAFVPANRLVPIVLSIANPNKEETATLSLRAVRARDGAETAVGFLPDGNLPSPAAPIEKTLPFPLDQQQVKLYLDARRVEFGQDHKIELNLVPSKGEPEKLTIRLGWQKPQLFQIGANGQRTEAIQISAKGRALVFLDLGSFREHKEAFAIVPETFLKDSTGDEVQLRLAPSTTRCAVHEQEKKPAASGLTLKPTALNCDEIPILLDGTELTPGGRYQGWIEISGVSDSSGAFRHRRPYIVTRVAASGAAVPVVSGTTVGEATCVLGCKPRITLTLHEQTGNLPLRVLAVKPVGTEPSELGSSAKLSAHLLTPQAVKTDLWTVDQGKPTDLAQRSLAAGDQATLVFEPKEALWPGEYKVKVKIAAENANAKRHPEVELTFRVFQRRWVPLLVLLGSVLLSYVISRGIGTRQRHRKLREAVKKLTDRGDDKAFRSTAPPVVQVRAELARIRGALARSHSLMRWVSVPTDLEARLAIVDKRLPALEMLADRANHWEQDTQGSEMVKRRAQRVLRGIVQDLADTAVDGEFSSDVLERLIELKRWEDPTQLAELYWLNLKTDILKLKSAFALSSYPGPNTSQLKELLANLLEGFRKLETAIVGIHALRDEIVAAAAGAVSKLQQVVAVEPQLVRQLGAALEKAQGLVDRAESQGLGELRGAVDEAVAIVAGTTLGSLWSNAAATEDELTTLPSAPEKTVRAIDAVGQLKGRDNDWLESGLRELHQAIADGSSSQRERIRVMLAHLESDRPPADLQKAIERELQYAGLKLISEHRDVKSLDADRQKLIEGRGNVEEFFADVDQWAWENLRNELRISKPAAGSTLEELRLIEFEISPKARGRGNNYLFKHGLDYQWEIYVGTSETPLLHPETHEPRVVQFIPTATQVRVQATAIRKTAGGNEQSTPVEPITFSTRESDELKWRSSFQRGELFALGFAMLIAAITGMSSEFFAPTLTGSFDTYLALIVWGIASERGTKLLKDFDTYVGR